MRSASRPDVQLWVGTRSHKTSTQSFPSPTLTSRRSSLHARTRTRTHPTACISCPPRAPARTRITHARTRARTHTGIGAGTCSGRAEQQRHGHSRCVFFSWTHACLLARTQACIHTHMHAWTHAYVHIFTYIHKHMHAYIHTCMHTCIHTYIHTYILRCVRT